MSFKDHTDLDLVQRCQAGDRGAQSELYHRYARAMLNCAYRILNNEEEAKDAMQDAFVKVFRNIKQYRGDSTIGAWIKRIVVNTAINQNRKGKRWVMTTLEPVHEVEPTPEEERDLELNARIALRALTLLPDGYRTVCTLYLVEGYDHNEISEILGISLSTSLSQYSRGKKKLRQLIEQIQHGQDRTILQGSQS